MNANLSRDLGGRDVVKPDKLPEALNQRIHSFEFFFSSAFTRHLLSGDKSKQILRTSPNRKKEVDQLTRSQTATQAGRKTPTSLCVAEFEDEDDDEYENEAPAA